MVKLDLLSNLVEALLDYFQTLYFKLKLLTKIEKVKI